MWRLRSIERLYTLVFLYNIEISHKEYIGTYIITN